MSWLKMPLLSSRFLKTFCVWRIWRISASLVKSFRPLEKRPFSLPWATSRSSCSSYSHWMLPRSWLLKSVLVVFSATRLFLVEGFLLLTDVALDLLHWAFGRLSHLPLPTGDGPGTVCSHSEWMVGKVLYSFGDILELCFTVGLTRRPW